MKAVQYTDEMRESDRLPDGVVIRFCPDGPHGPDDYACIDTPDGNAIVSPGDWVITLGAGRGYSVKGLAHGSDRC